MKRLRILQIFLNLRLTTLLTVALLFSCHEEDVDVETDETEVSLDTSFATNSQQVSYNNAVLVSYSGTAATITNPFSSSGVSIQTNGADVTITSAVSDTEIYYVVSGTTTDGSLKIYSDYKFNVVLNGASIINNDGPAINIQSEKKATVTLQALTNNRIADSKNYATSDEDQKGALFSEGQVIFTGSGSLLAYGRYKHAIASDDYISVTDGIITVESAVSDGIHANDYVEINEGTIVINASGDGIDAEEGYVEISGGSLEITSAGKGITASYEGDDATIVPYVTITGGDLAISTTGESESALQSEGDLLINTSGALKLTASGKGSKGLKSNGDLTIESGTIIITTTGSAFYDTGKSDIVTPAGINCDGNLAISGGTMSIVATGSGGKGISVDGELSVKGGATQIKASGAAFSSNGLSAEAKGIKADGAISIQAGSVTVAATDDGVKSETSFTLAGGELLVSNSKEGIEAPQLTFANGAVTVVSTDDCLNATNGNGGEGNDNSLITFAGGTVALNSSGGDTVDSNGNIVMTGGTVVAQGPASAPELALDYNGTFKISGGLFVGSGPNAGNMVEATSTSSTQNTLLLKFSPTVSANTIINIQTTDGTSVVTYQPMRAAYYLVVSSPLLQMNGSFKVYTGGSVSGGTNMNGLTENGSYTGGTLRGTVTASSKVTTSGL